MSDQHDTARYEQLRQQILSQIAPLLDSDALDPEERFTLAMRLAELHGDFDQYQRAYDVATNIQDGDAKLRSYMQLLDSIEFELSEAESASGADQPVESPVIEADNDQPADQPQEHPRPEPEQQHDQ